MEICLTMIVHQLMLKLIEKKDYPNVHWTQSYAQEIVLSRLTILLIDHFATLKTV
jgi:hypothetical protein